MKLGGLEIALIVVAIVLIFGVGKLGQLGGALGKSIREFRKEKDKGEEQAHLAEARSEKPVAQIETKTGKDRFCPNCGEKLAGNAKFCMGCGARLDNYAA
jgi:sec-independent protein translocase protein TatA